MYKKWMFEAFGRKIGINFGMSKKPDLLTAGIVNETGDGYFVPFIDYDHVEYDVIINDLKHLNKVFGFCWFMITTSSEEDVDDGLGGSKLIGSYQVWGIDKMTYQRHLEMLRHTRCDFAYRKIARVYSARNWILRFYKKEDLETGEIVRIEPFLKEIITFPNYDKKRHDIGCEVIYNDKMISIDHSIEHINFYEKYFGIGINQDKVRLILDEVDEKGFPEIRSYMTRRHD